MKIAVLGGGALGAVFVSLLKKNGYESTVFDLAPEKSRCDHCTDNIQECVEGADLVFVCVPSFAVRDCISKCAQYLHDSACVINCSKGLEKDSLRFLTDVIQEEVSCSVAELSGPAIASEIDSGIHTKVDLVVKDDVLFEKINSVLSNDFFGCVRCDDMHGVELGGIMKNVYALLCGIIDGVHGGTNTKSFLMTEGMHEMAKLAAALGAKEETMHGLAGLGDLITTCMNKKSRNRTFGEALAGGDSVEVAMENLGMVAEGYYAVATIKSLADAKNVELRLLNVLYEFLYSDLDLDGLMKRIVSDDIMECS